MPCTESYREHIMYTFNGYCKTVIRFAAINAWRDRSRRRQKEISLEYLTEEKFYPLGVIMLLLGDIILFKLRVPLHNLLI